MSNLLAFILAFGVWAAVHSLTASEAFKTIIERWVGHRAYAGLYRLSYNAFSLVSFLPVLYLAAVLLPDERIWSVATPWSLLLVALQLVGAAGLIVSVVQTGVMRFAGIRQAYYFVQGQRDPGPPSELVTSGVYALVRHPIYFFSLLLLWFSPVMTWQTLVFNALATLYFWLGSVFEERRLMSTFGRAYATYCAQTPRLIPLRRPF